MTEPVFALPVHLDILIAEPADWSLAFTLTDADGDVIDITNDTVTLVAYERRSGTVPLIEKANGPTEHTTPEEGVTTFALVPSDTGFVETRQHILEYEVWRTYDGGKQTPWFEGILVFKALRGLQ